MALTGKKRAFADAVLAGLSNKDAAIAAGYSPKTAAPAGSRLVKDPDVVQYLADQRKQIDERAVDKSAPPAPGPASAAPARPAFDLAALMHFSDPKAFLKAVMNEPKAELKQRVDAAKALLPFEHHKKGEGGKKEEDAEKAKKAGAGRFAAAPPPKLVAAGGKKV